VREVHIAGVVSGAAPDDVFAAVTDVEAFPAFCSDVQQVRVDVADGVRRSAWKVHFRGGTLEWLEHDELDPAARTMTFRRIDGDFKEFHGSWHVEDRGPHCAVDFNVSFDLGIPGLRAVLEPIAAKSLRGNLSAVLRGLFGSALQLEGGQ
jgi:ribosome-associated toxin RatA of RatAB toxin-antitoxin module